MTFVPKYKRILIKLSGEFISSNNEGSISISALNYIYEELKKIKEHNIQFSIVIGGGNIFRGEFSRQKEKFKDFQFSRVIADKTGMLATVINGLLLADFLNQHRIKTKVMSTIFIDFVEFFEAEKARKYLDEGWCLIFTGGTANPFVSTDTTAVIKALETVSDVLLKATKVDGVYNKDPKKFSDAKKFDKLSFSEAIEKKLKVMDLAAFSLAMENNLPIIVFDFSRPDNLLNIIKGEKIGTIIE